MGKFTDMLRERLNMPEEKRAKVLKERAKSLDAKMVGSENLADLYTKHYLNLILHYKKVNLMRVIIGFILCT